MARLPLASRDSVPEDQRATFDEMIRELGAVPRYGPGSVMVHVPKAHQWATALNHYLRDESSLPKKIQELAMLVTRTGTGLPAHLECACGVSPPGRCAQRGR